MCFSCTSHQFVFVVSGFLLVVPFSLWVDLSFTKKDRTWYSYCWAERLLESPLLHSTRTYNDGVTFSLNTLPPINIAKTWALLTPWFVLSIFLENWTLVCQKNMVSPKYWAYSLTGGTISPCNWICICQNVEDKTNMWWVVQLTSLHHTWSNNNDGNTFVTFLTHSI